MSQLSNNFAGSAQQVALLEKKVKELEDAGYQHAAEILSLKKTHNKELEELKTQLTQAIEEHIHLANQLEQSKKSNVTSKDKYQALQAEKKGRPPNFPPCQLYSADIFPVPQLNSC